MKEKLTLGGSLLSVLLASVCCLGPVLALLGVTGLGFASFLVEWRPYLLGVTFLLLGLAIFLTYRKSKSDCTDGSCQPKNKSWVNKAILWSAVVVVLAMAAFPHYAHSIPTSSTSIDSCCTLKKSTTSNSTNQSPKAQLQCCKPNKEENMDKTQNLASLDINKLKEEFNNSSQEVRVIAILSPSCPACQCGQGMLKKVFSKYPSTQLKGFVSWAPMLSGDDAKVANIQSQNFQDERINQTWDPQHQTGKLFANTLGLKKTAWDVYLLYEPGVKWQGDTPPQPTFWMHQLKEDSGANQQLCLNQDTFSNELAKLLTNKQQLNEK